MRKEGKALPAQKTSSIQSVPTNIITGFLGVGKTSAILHLLRNKPDDERWAVLVNEFGEIGVDGSLLQGQYKSENGVYIAEVAGGCMCCAAGVPMTIALNQLLLKAKPDRLLIEPTGLGHPKEVLAVLTSEHYREVLLLQKTLTLVDARNLTDERYTSHNTFNQQIAIADTIIGNKVDLYQAGDKERLVDYIQRRGKHEVELQFAEYGDIALSTLSSTLSGKSLDSFQQRCCQSDEHNHSHHHHEHHYVQNSKPEFTKRLVADLPIPECGFIKAENIGEGFHSIGWRFAAGKVFNHQQVDDFVSSLQVERLKAVFITDEGVFGYNFSDGEIRQIALDNCLESRIEIIARILPDDLDARLQSCELIEIN